MSVVFGEEECGKASRKKWANMEKEDKGQEDVDRNVVRQEGQSDVGGEANVARQGVRVEFVFSVEEGNDGNQAKADDDDA